MLLMKIVDVACLDGGSKGEQHWAELRGINLCSDESELNRRKSSCFCPVHYLESRCIFSISLLIDFGTIVD